MLVAGCGGEKAASTGIVTTGGSSAGPQRVTMKGIEFLPKSLKAGVKRPVLWDNRDKVEHTVVARSGAEFRSDTLGPGGTFEFTPKEPGTIDYVCTIHPGMEGTLDVKE